jgi:hypothetical protein
LIFILASAIIAFLIPFLNTLFLINTFRVWFSELLRLPLSLILYVLISLSSGALVALQFYNLSKHKVCSFAKANASGFLGLISAFSFGVCPSCIGLLGLIFPLGATLALAQFRTAFNILSLGLILFSIYLLGGFKDD